MSLHRIKEREREAGPKEKEKTKFFGRPGWRKEAYDGSFDDAVFSRSGRRKIASCTFRTLSALRDCKGKYSIPSSNVLKVDICFSENFSML